MSSAWTTIPDLGLHGLFRRTTALALFCASAESPTSPCSHPMGARTARTARRSRRFTPSWIRSEEHTSELQSLMRLSYAVFCLKTQNHPHLHGRGLGVLEVVSRPSAV